MEKSDNKNDFPTGSSGGGGKRGYGIRSFLHPTGEESPPNEVIPNSDNKTSESSQDRPSPNEQNVVTNSWLDELDNLRVAGCDENQESSASSTSTGLDSNAQVNDGESVKSDEVNVRPGEHFGITIYNYAGYIGIPNIHGGIGFNGYVGAPVLGQGGLALRLNGSNAVEYNRASVANGGNLGGVQGDHGMAVVQGQAQAGPVEIIASGRDASHNIMRNNNGNIFYYTTTTAYAHRRLNGEVLSEMFSLRDAHIFNIINVTDYAGPISQICNNPDLADAMINHIDCLKILGTYEDYGGKPEYSCYKSYYYSAELTGDAVVVLRALLTRNIPDALANQMSCVNAVMRLVNEAYSNQEDWATQFIQTVDYDLRIISDRASNRGCRSRAIIRYNWTANTVMVYFHPDDCQCNQAKNI